MNDDTVYIIARSRGTHYEYWNSCAWWYKQLQLASQYSGPNRQALANAELARVLVFAPDACIITVTSEQIDASWSRKP